jgi:hypothetical protein
VLTNLKQVRLCTFDVSHGACFCKVKEKMDVNKQGCSSSKGTTLSKLQAKSLGCGQSSGAGLRVGCGCGCVDRERGKGEGKGDSTAEEGLSGVLCPEQATKETVGWEVVV